MNSGSTVAPSGNIPYGPAPSTTAGRIHISVPSAPTKPNVSVMLADAAREAIRRLEQMMTTADPIVQVQAAEALARLYLDQYKD